MGDVQRVVFRLELAQSKGKASIDKSINVNNEVKEGRDVV
jgi:hypothetical protein